MNEVNELWSSAWRQLQKNLASGFAAGCPDAGDRLFGSPLQGRSAPPGTSWLMRARRAEQSSRIIQ